MTKSTLFFLVHITNGTLQCTIGYDVLPTPIAAPPLPLIYSIAVHRFVVDHLAAAAHSLQGWRLSCGGEEEVVAMAAATTAATRTGV